MATPKPYQNTTPMKKMRVAICLYGQPRTALYCAPWIHETFSFMPTLPTRLWHPRRLSGEVDCMEREFEIDYFCDIKSRSDSGHTIGGRTTNNTSTELHKIREIYKPKKYTLTPSVIDDEILKTGPFYTTMYSSICRAVQLKQLYESEENFIYDWVFVSRYDTLVGPNVDSLKKYVQINGVQPLTIYGIGGEQTRFMFESFRAGPNDFMWWGDSFAVDTLCAKLLETWATNNPIEDLRAVYHLGPNTTLAISLCDSGLVYQPVPFAVCLVRGTAELSIPVFDSFDYHARFWVNNHPALKQ